VDNDTHLSSSNQNGAIPFFVLVLFVVHQHAGAEDTPEFDPVAQARSELGTRMSVYEKHCIQQISTIETL
jgi:hypothetical protein